MEMDNLKHHHWRKHWQWFVLNRLHAKVVTEDEDVALRFAWHCWNGWDPDYNTWRTCFSGQLPALKASPTHHHVHLIMPPGQ